MESTLTEYTKQNFDLSVIKRLKSGKEADVYIVAHEGTNCILKLYKEASTRGFQAQDEYLAGRYYKKPSVRKAVKNKTTFGKKYIHRAWIKREFNILDKVYQKGAHVPEPHAKTDSSLVMQLIGDNIEPAPRLIELELSEKTGSNRVGRNTQ